MHTQNGHCTHLPRAITPRVSAQHHAQLYAQHTARASGQHMYGWATCAWAHNSKGAHCFRTLPSIGKSFFTARASHLEKIGGVFTSRVCAWIVCLAPCLYTHKWADSVIWCLLRCSITICEKNACLYLNAYVKSFGFRWNLWIGCRFYVVSSTTSISISLTNVSFLIHFLFNLCNIVTNMHLKDSNSPGE